MVLSLQLNQVMMPFVARKPLDGPGDGVEGDHRGV